MIERRNSWRYFAFIRQTKIRIAKTEMERERTADFLPYEERENVEGNTADAVWRYVSATALAQGAEVSQVQLEYSLSSECEL